MPSTTVAAIDVLRSLRRGGFIEIAGGTPYFNEDDTVRRSTLAATDAKRRKRHWETAD